MTQLYQERLSSANPVAPDLVLLHGWASSSAIWRSLLPLLRPHFNILLIDLPGCGASAEGSTPAQADLLLEQLLPRLPASALYLGWSWGGMLAARLAVTQPERVRALVTVAANARFVASEEWPDAMAPARYQAFADTIVQHPGKGLQRFQLLQCHGDANAKALRSQLSYLHGTGSVPSRGALQAPVQATADNLSAGLQCLSSIDNSNTLAQCTAPALHIFGAEDALVPAAAAAVFTRRYPAQKTKVMADCGHLPFLSQPRAFIDTVLAFAQRHGLLTIAPARRFHKRDVARSFSRAAQSYDGVAALQRRVADQLLTQLPARSGRLMELGCGTGYSLPALKQAGAEAIVAVDIAEGMLRHARQHHREDADHFLCGDAEDLPLADASVDTVFSSLSLQWCENFHAVCAELARVLRPGGRALIATLGPATLGELRRAWAAVDGYVHVNQFDDRQTLEKAVTASGLQVQQWQCAEEVLHYRRLGELTRELKNLGAHNVNGGRPGGLAGRRRLLALTEAYEQFRTADGQLPASYEVWIVTLAKRSSL